MGLGEMQTALLYLAVGFSLFAFFVVDDIKHGRGLQRRDYHILVWWPLLLFVIFVLGLFEFSRITSGRDGDDLAKPEKWLGD